MMYDQFKKRYVKRMMQDAPHVYISEDDIVKMWDAIIVFSQLQNEERKPPLETVNEKELTEKIQELAKDLIKEVQKELQKETMVAEPPSQISETFEQYNSTDVIETKEDISFVELCKMCDGLGYLLMDVPGTQHTLCPTCRGAGDEIQHPRKRKEEPEWL
ncbi:MULTISPECIES: hypothetical protein [Bacillaceae]|uniref:Uncharacterized protein n=1 Tax=Domibacillus aminovorans TaxID=29332 RepID=A0A177KWQ0_9BACI|nr:MULTISPECIES: hypothetical protein [Bacillaceae]OAH57810.1 hypothetical protein AWH48_01990 [Domibacillus aminovorans]